MNSTGFEIWRLVAGIGIFLLGMRMLEDALKQLAGRNFKLFLKKQTSKRINAIAGGAVVTGLLQSSSVTNLMVLAFVGSGILTMQNALAVIMGANLGTTLTTWLVAAAGFNINIEDYALPVVGIAGIAYMLLKRNNKVYYWAMMMLGLGLLFVGLDFMKNGILSSVSHFNFAALSRSPLAIFVLVGLLITSLIQSSSATIAIALSALYAGAIGLYQGMGIVLGAEIGTTLKLLLASVGGISIKKRVALGNFLFNTIGVIIIFLCIAPIYRLVTFVSSSDHLIALAFFQSFMNIVSILIFYPFLGIFSKFLERRFLNDSHTTLYLHKVNTADTGLSLEAMEKETGHLLHSVIHFSQEIFHLPHNYSGDAMHPDYAKKQLLEKYEFIKHLHGDIYAYYISLNKIPNSKEEVIRLDSLVAAVRNGMYAAKSIKDALYDIELLRNSSNEIKYNYYRELKKLAGTFYNCMAAIAGGSREMHFEELVQLYRFVQQRYDTAVRGLYTSTDISTLSEVEVSTILNLDREIFSSMKALIFLAKDYLLTEKDAAYFNELPGFIN